MLQKELLTSKIQAAIAEQYPSKAAFARVAGISYYALQSMLQGRVLTSEFGTVWQVCKVLNIEIREFDTDDDVADSGVDTFGVVTQSELYAQYMRHPESRRAILKLLDIAPPAQP